MALTGWAIEVSRSSQDALLSQPVHCFEAICSIGSPQITDTRIVGLGNNECTVLFNIEFDSEHKLKWEKVLDPSEGYTETCSDWVYQSNTVSGTAKLIIDPIAKTVASVGMVAVDGSEIELCRLPRR